jgi:Protein of unknown function (DUF982)
MEVAVNDRTFGSPVFVKSSTHLIHEIVTLEDALDFLEEWPLARRGPIYETALKACHRAYIRDVPLDVGLKAFVGFAKSAGIYEKLENMFPSLATARRSGPSGLPA